jgi:hypothetical protein
MKKIIEYSTCMDESWTVDGKDLREMDKTETDNLLQYLLIKVQDHINDGSLFITDLIRLFQYDEIDFNSESCDQCGDTSSTTTWEI